MNNDGVITFQDFLILARDFGNGVIDITTRQQVQLRNLKIDDVPEIFEIQEEVGLTSIQTFAAAELNCESSESGLYVDI